MNHVQVLEKLLLSLFNADALRRFLRNLPDGEDIAQRLPGTIATQSQLISEAVAVLVRDARINRDFWLRLAEVRPLRGTAITAAEAAWAAPSRGDEGLVLRRNDSRSSSS